MSMLKKYILSFFLMIPLLAGTLAHSASQEFDLIQPLTKPDTRITTSDTDTATIDKKESYITQEGFVQLDVSTLWQAYSFAKKNNSATKQNTKLQISLFQDEKRGIIIDTLKRTKESYFLSGHLEGELSTFSMTITEGSYIITFQVPDTTILYRVVGDMNSGVGQVKKIDTQKRPAIIHLPSRIPPE